MTEMQQMMATKRNKTEHHVVVDDKRFAEVFEALNDRMDKYEAMMNRLLEAVTEQFQVKGPNGEAINRRRVKATPAQLHQLYLKKARQMRQGKAAKRFGLTRQEFVTMFGDIDHMPDGVEPPKEVPKATTKKAKTRSKKKTAKKKTAKKK